MGFRVNGTCLDSMGRTAHLTAYRSTYLGEGQSLKFHDPVYDTRGVLAIRIFFLSWQVEKKVVRFNNYIE